MFGDKKQKVEFARKCMEDTLIKKRENLVRLKFDFIMAEKAYKLWQSKKPEIEGKKEQIKKLTDSIREIKGLTFDKAKKAERQKQIVEIENQIVAITQEITKYEQEDYTYVTSEYNRLKESVEGNEALVFEVRAVLKDESALEKLADEGTYGEEKN